MAAELLEPIATVEAIQTPPVLAAYDSFTTPEAQTAFGERVTEGRQLFDIERTTFDAEKARLDTLSETLQSGGVPENEHEGAYDVLYASRTDLLHQQDQLRKDWAFTDARENLWRDGGQYRSMLFDREDPAVSGLLEGLSGGAETTEQPFIQYTDFMRMADQDRPGVVIEAIDKPLEFPLTSVVSAVGFESWQTGRGQGGLKDGRQSADVIKDYASRETPLPPVDDATALIFEDGRVVIMTSNAHRVGAAKLRGQENIQINRLKVRRIKEEQPRETSSEGIGVLAVANTVSEPEDVQTEQAVTAELATSPNLLNKWRSFVAGVSYHRKHRQH